MKREWISVFLDLDGPKLRRLCHAIGCSKPEAAGILLFLWFFGANGNANANGFLVDTELDEIGAYLQGNGVGQSDYTATVLEALIETGFLDKTDDGYVIHNWAEHQKYFIKYKKENDGAVERMRRMRTANKSCDAPVREAPPAIQEAESQATEDQSQPNNQTQNKKAKKEPAKIKYADNVSMTEDERQKLFDKYGERFTAACIETLNLYKGSKGKTYKSDYLAILNWVVDRVNEKRPGLMKASIADAEDGKNPYTNFGGHDG